jgi:hypothetical protein
MACELCPTRGNFMEPCPTCLPPPLKLERQLTESKWEYGEETMKQDIQRKELLVAQSGHHIYKVVRQGDSLIRVYGNESCSDCRRNDIRYPKFESLYRVCGFLCGKCATSK